MTVTAGHRSGKAPRIDARWLRAADTGAGPVFPCAERWRQRAVPAKGGGLMRSFAVIGSGIAGLLTAHGLLRAGNAVTLFSDRTPEQWLHDSRPTGTAGRFEGALSYERELGLNYWEHLAPCVTGVHCTLCTEPRNRVLTLTGRIEKPFLAIDVRLQSHRWMQDLTQRGGRLVVEPVTLARLDEIAAQHDLTIVATGKSELSNLFERDAARSVYDKPQRHLAMLVLRKRLSESAANGSASRGPDSVRDAAPPSAPASGRRAFAAMRFAGLPFVAVKFNILGAAGEVLCAPYYHMTVGESWNLIFEAKPGGPMDVFQGAKSAAEALELARGVFRQIAPWESAWIEGMEPADPNGWLVGAVAPTVRKPVGKLPSGRVVTSVGDTAMVFDPIGGQGANNGTRMARHLVESIARNGDLPFDAAWMTRTFDAFFDEHGAFAYAFNNSLLGTPSASTVELLIAQYGSDGLAQDGRQALADAFARNFEDPRRLTRVLQDLGATRRLIEQSTGQAWWRAAVRGRIGIARGQIRQKLGLAPGHPLEVA